MVYKAAFGAFGIGGMCLAGIVFPSALPFLVNAIPVLALVVLSSRLKAHPLSPVSVVVGIFSTIGFFGFLFMNQLNGVAGGGMLLSIGVASGESTAYLFFATSSLILLGASVWMVLDPVHGRGGKLGRVVLRGRRARVSLFVTFVPILMILGTLGETFLRRGTYLAAHSGSIGLGLGQQLAIVCVAVLGNISAGDSRKMRLVAGLLFAGYLLLFLGLGSRRLALGPIIFALGFVLARRERGRLVLGLSAMLSVLLLPLPLLLRSLPVHGLLPYVSSIFTGGLSLKDLNVAEIANNVLISFQVTGVTAFESPKIPLENLAISLNPAPGAMAGWYSISSSMNLNPWTPFSAIGELGNYGIPWIALIWGGVGILLGWLDSRMAALMKSGQQLVAIAVLGLVFLFAIQAIQYSLRSSTRMLLYASAICLVAGMLRRPKSKVSPKVLSD